MYFSKSQYLRYKQCCKAVWLHHNKPEIKNINEEVEHVLEKGIKVRKVAQKLFPNGIKVNFNSDDFLDMVLETKRLIELGATTIYKGAFIYNDVLAICDILHKDENGWNIYEVNSSTGIKDRHLDDITIQYYIAKNSGLDINSINIIHINKDYIRSEDLELNKLFIIEDKTYDVIDNLYNIDNDLNKIKAIIVNKEPNMDIGMRCDKYNKENFECAFKNYCYRHIPDFSIFDIGGMTKTKKFELYNDKILKIEDIPEDYNLDEIQKLQVKAIKENIEIINNKEIKKYLKKFSYPLYFLDFESYQQAIPQFKGIKPYQQIPFQYSLHILEDENKQLIHKEFLGKEGMDSRRALAERLIKDIPQNVCTVAYNMGFEKRVIKDLANLFPDLKEHLMNIQENMVDIMVPFQKKWYYTKGMKGSYSIKYVLPALFPNNDELNYKNLDIQNGAMAMHSFENLHEKEEHEIELIRKSLLKYCKLDTLAMVMIYKKLCDVI